MMLELPILIIYSPTLLLFVLERLSTTHYQLESNSLLTFYIQTELMSLRMKYVKSQLKFTRLKRTLSPSLVSEPNSVVPNLLVSVQFTTPLLTPRSSNQPTDQSDTVQLKRLKRLLDNKESKRRTETRKSLVLVREELRRLPVVTLIKKRIFMIYYIIVYFLF